MRRNFSSLKYKGFEASSVVLLYSVASECLAFCDSIIFARSRHFNDGILHSYMATQRV